jgi:hypothetical protein
MKPHFVSPCVFLPFCLMFLVSCKNSFKRNRSLTEGQAFTQKITIKKTDSIQLELDSVTSNYISCIQYKNENNIEELIYLNEETGTIYINDLNTRKIIKCIIPKLPEKKLKKKFQGFYYHNKDSIFLFAFSPKVFLVNDSGTIKDSYETSSLQAAEADRKIYQAFYVSTRNMPGFYNNKLYLNAVILGNLREGEQRKVQVIIDVASKKVSLGIQYYPEEYYRNYAGMDYYIYSTAFNPLTSEIVYSYPAMDSVVILSLRENKTKKVYAGSKFISEILEYDPSDYKNAPSGLEGEYFMRNPSFGPILYDEYRKVYYRVAFLPVDEKNAIYEAKNAPTKQVSIVAYDSQFNYLGESLLEKDKFWPNNVFVSRKGVCIQNKTEADSTFDFSTFSFNF